MILLPLIKRMHPNTSAINKARPVVELSLRKLIRHEKQLEVQTKLFDDRHAADLRDQQLLMDARENQLKRNFSELNLTFQKKIDKMTVENDTKLKLITNDYESKLKELKALSSKEGVQKDTAHQMDLDRIKQTYDEEKKRIVDAFEVQIDSIKKGHEDQMKQMANYKRIS